MAYHSRLDVKYSKGTSRDLGQWHWDRGHHQPELPKACQHFGSLHTLYSCVPLKYFPPSSEHAGKEPPQAFADSELYFPVSR